MFSELLWVRKGTWGNQPDLDEALNLLWNVRGANDCEKREMIKVVIKSQKANLV